MTTTSLKTRWINTKVKFGCDCEMKEFARQSTENYHKKQKRIKAEKIFKQSIINQSLANATFDNYKIDENTQPQLAKAKRICKNTLIAST